MRTNFNAGRLRKQDVYPDTLQPSMFATAIIPTFMNSLIVQIRNTFQIDSATGGVVTFSMSGYGVPQWIILNQASAVLASIQGWGHQASITTDDSIVYLSFFHSVCFNSLAATTSLALYITGLIASR